MSQATLIQDVVSQYEAGMLSVYEALARLVYENVPASRALQAIRGITVDTEMRAFRYIGAFHHLHIAEGREIDLELGLQHL